MSEIKAKVLCLGLACAAIRAEAQDPTSLSAIAFSPSFCLWRLGSSSKRSKRVAVHCFYLRLHLLMASASRQLSRNLDGDLTELLVQTYADRILVLVTQLGKVGSMVPSI